MTLTEARRIVAMIAVHRPYPALPTETLDLWAHELLDLEYDLAWAATRGMLSLLAATDPTPGPGDLRRYIVRVHCMMAGNPILDGDEAFGRLLKAARSRGLQGDPSKNSLLRAAADAFGWRELCLADESALPTLRAQFRRVYNAIVEREMAVACAPGSGCELTPLMAAKPPVVLPAPLTTISRTPALDARGMSIDPEPDRETIRSLLRSTIRKLSREPA